MDNDNSIVTDLELDTIVGGQGEKIINAVATAIIKAAIASGDLEPMNRIGEVWQCK